MNTFSHLIPGIQYLQNWFLQIFLTQVVRTRVWRNTTLPFGKHCTNSGISSKVHWPKQQRHQVHTDRQHRQQNSASFPPPPPRRNGGVQERSRGGMSETASRLPRLQSSESAAEQPSSTTTRPTTWQWPTNDLVTHYGTEAGHGNLQGACTQTPRDHHLLVSRLHLEYSPLIIQLIYSPRNYLFDLNKSLARL